MRSLCVFCVLISSITITSAQTKFEGIGRAATPAEVKAWDIDVRPDFKGLPPGKGSVIQGEKIWEAQCAGCHGSFGESNEVFTPIAGNTTAKDIETGRVASLLPGANTPQRTTLMKLSSISTLWDYVNRAMPWTAPKSMTADEVYAVTAYMLNLGNIVPGDFTLSDQNIRDVQNRLPNRNGKTTAHAMWPGNELGGMKKPDVQGSACMKDCKQEPKVASFLPAHARDAHGNLAEQSRGLGGSRGADTTQPAAVSAALVSKPNQALTGKESALSATNSGASVAAAPVVATPNTMPSSPAASAALKSADVMPTLQKYACIACHGMDNKLVGPSFKEIVAKQGKRVDAQAYLAAKIKNGGQGVYGQIPMPAQSISEAESSRVAQWLVQGAQR
ncbi:c-type cytochrome [Variovorax sp. PCZ-1]|uniref:c-type cytochrome n=1 Tax=Variovorax sp. PCZ-1 TaxID=2835533 RepID=UPI0020C04048|nr:c-type cytochrome [Variovorax sp. PCZ-1]